MEFSNTNKKTKTSDFSGLDQKYIEKIRANPEKWNQFLQRGRTLLNVLNVIHRA